MASKEKEERTIPSEVWDQQPEENASQYFKFCRYRDMKYIGQNGEQLDGIKNPYGKRSLRVLAKQLEMKTHKTIGVLAARFHWQERCESYDLEIDRQARDQAQRSILKMRKDHADLAAQMVKKAAKRLLTIPEEELSASDIVRLVDVGVKIERLSRGESTENKQISGAATVNHTGTVAVKGDPNALSLSDLSDEELERLEGLLEKLHPESGV